MPAPRGLIQQLDHELHRGGIVAPRQRLLIGCSGGADSVALLHLMHAINRSNHWQWRILVGHVDHGMRAESAEDAAFVERLAAKLGLGFLCTRLDVMPASEAAARVARLNALAEMSRQQACDAVVLAHHADDQAETVLLRMLRGTGVRGLAAMRPRRRLYGAVFVRPLLGTTRAALRRYLTQQGLAWREDQTNRSPKYLRNRVRHEVLPVLESLQPAIRDLLVRLADNAHSASAAIAQEARRVQGERAAGTIRFTRQELRAMSQAALAVLLTRAATTLCRERCSVNKAQLSRSVAAIRGTAGGLEFTFGRTVRLMMDKRHVTVALIGEAETAARGRGKKPILPL